MTFIILLCFQLKLFFSFKLNLCDIFQLHFELIAHILHFLDLCSIQLSQLCHAIIFALKVAIFCFEIFVLGSYYMKLFLLDFNSFFISIRKFLQLLKFFEIVFVFLLIDYVDR